MVCSGAEIERICADIVGSIDECLPGALLDRSHHHINQRISGGAEGLASELRLKLSHSEGEIQGGIGGDNGGRIGDRGVSAFRSRNRIAISWSHRQIKIAVEGCLGAETN